MTGQSMALPARMVAVAVTEFLQASERAAMPRSLMAASLRLLNGLPPKCKHQQGDQALPNITFPYEQLLPYLTDQQHSQESGPRRPAQFPLTSSSTSVALLGLQCHRQEQHGLGLQLISCSHPGPLSMACQRLALKPKVGQYFPSPLPFRSYSSHSTTTPTRKSAMPDAAETDAAMADYQELRARLNRLDRPSSLKTTQQMIMDAMSAIGRGTLAVGRFLASLPTRIAAWREMTPEDWAKWRSETWATIKHEAHHYWVGTKLLGYEIRIASRHAIKAAQGKQLTRRERAQLTRTTADLFRLVPMVIIIVIPFLEFALPLLLRIFPNMLPSTFEDKLKKEEELKRRLSLRLELARFLQDTVAEMAADLVRRKGGSKDAEELKKFIQKVRAGQLVDNSEMIRFARLFNDELTLDHLERVQLVSMCQFVGISPFGTDAFLRTRLRQHLQQIKQDDYEIEQEGLEHLTEEELRAACRARGMKAPYGEGATRYMQRQLQDWLDLSLHRGLPSSLLLLSRAFTITAKAPGEDVGAAKDAKYEKLKETLGVIPEEVVDSVAIEQLGIVGDKVEALQQRLEFLKREEEAIRAELDRAEAAAKAAALAEAAIKQAIKEGQVPGLLPEPGAAAQPTAAAAEPSVGAALTPSPATPAGEAHVAAPAEESFVAPEEAAQAAAEARERRLRAVIGSLLDMATGSAVAKERALFMSLMRKEMDRVNSELAETGGKGSSTGTMSFSSGGLQIEKPTVVGIDEVGAEPVSHQPKGLPHRLSERVSRMLTSIEAELDAVESKIGQRLHVLDTDADGRVTAQELEQALGFLRAQLSPAELSELLLQLKTAARRADAGEDLDKDSIQVSELLNLAGQQEHGEKEKSSATSAQKNSTQ